MRKSKFLWITRARDLKRFKNHLKTLILSWRRPLSYRNQSILNDIIMAKNSEYINVDKILAIEGRPIVAGPCYHTSVVSQILHVIMEPTLFFLLNIF